MESLTERQKFILTLVIHDFTRSATPVGSQHLVTRYHLDMSPATVRNEMAVLTELGYLRKPSKVAGSVPTEEGYRFFVGRLLRDTELPEPEQRTISHQFSQMPQDMGQWVRLAASVLAYQARAVSLVTAPHPMDVRLRHLELISTRGRQVLMVLVLMGGEIRQQLLTFDEPVSQEQLSQCADRLTQSDFACPLGHRYQHDIHDTDPADQQRNTRDGAQENRQCIEGRGQRILNGCSAKNVEISSS